MRLLKYIGAICIALWWAIEDAYYWLKEKLIGKRFAVVWALVALGSCSVVFPTRPSPVFRTVTLELKGSADGCEEAFSRAVAYLRGVGVRVRVQPGGMVLSCFSPVGGPARVVNALVGVEGMADRDGGVAWVMLTPGRLEFNTKLMLHEIGHLLGADHSPTGFMIFDTSLMQFATGFSKQSLREMGLNK